MHINHKHEFKEITSYLIVALKLNITSVDHKLMQS